MSPPLHDKRAESSLGRAAARLCFGGYALLGRLASPLVRHLLRRRLVRGREDPQRVAERFGRASRPRPRGPLLWLHAASVGEAQSALALITRLQKDQPDFAILITSGTVTSARFLAERLPGNVIHQYIPVDLPAAVTGFLDHWRPSIGLFIESELWPNLLRTAARAGTTLVLLNGRISPRSYRRWGHAPALIRHLLSCFTVIMARSPEDRDRLRALGAEGVILAGDLKAAAPPLTVDQTALEELKQIFSDRPLWLAASTHPGEDRIVGDIHLMLRERFPGLLTLLAPRHPERATEIRQELEDLGLRVAQRSHRESLDGDVDVYLLDTIGEMGLWYRIVETVFVGGSLVPKGGQNLMEPAKLGCAMLTGPYTTNFAQLADELAEAGALRRVEDAQNTASAVAELLADPGARQSMIAAALNYADGRAGVLERIVEALEPTLVRAAVQHRQSAE